MMESGCVLLFGFRIRVGNTNSTDINRISKGVKPSTEAEAGSGGFGKETGEDGQLRTSDRRQVRPVGLVKGGDF